MEFGQWLRDQRTRRALKTRALAAKVGISAAYVSSLELGKRLPSSRVIKTLASFFEVHPMEIHQRMGTKVEIVRAARGHPHQDDLADLIRVTRNLDGDGMRALVETVRQSATRGDE